MKVTESEKLKKNEEKLKIFCQRYFLLLTKTRPKEKRPETHHKPTFDSKPEYLMSTINM